jgi:bacterioferritin (cytochrome b1)
MDRQTTLDHLRELLSAERASLVSHLAHAGIELHGATAQATATVRELTARHQAHVTGLVELIQELGGTPPLPQARVSHAEYHHRLLGSIWPDLDRELTQLCDLYSAAARPHLLEPRAHVVVQEILADHQRYLAEVRAQL